ncbi:MAG TPA: histidine kinase [Acidobacteriota bacterium]|jgi:hypothetical protein|nr:histidine kinase [Acidobacteriota bacterium]
MNILRLASLLIFTFGAISFEALFVLWLRELRKQKAEWLDLANGAILFVSACWFLLNLGVELASFYPGIKFRWVNILLFTTAYLYPPLIVHVFYLDYRQVPSSSSVKEVREHLPPSQAWKWIIGALYMISFSLALVPPLVGFRILPDSRTLGSRLTVMLFTLFITAAALSVLLVLRSHHRAEDPTKRSGYRKWVLALLSLMILVFVPMLATSVGWIRYAQFIDLFSRSLPLYFIFASTYYHTRFAFFDIFIKGGSFFFATLVLLTTYFALAPPWLENLKPGWGKPWLYAITLLPLALALPWVYRKLAHWLDRAWLGRNFSKADALKYFLAGVQEATSEGELIKQAETRLANIFRASTQIALGSVDSLKDKGSASPLPYPARHRRVSQCQTVWGVPIRSHGEKIGVVQMGPRANDTPYLSEDVTQLMSLADVFSNMLENIRLQEKKQQQEKREQELMLHASRSELKALRAQINPHFLFNALNAIAGLIHQNPGRAEETVEQLAEVFRYTLTRSENEWVWLREEMEFVRSYLEVEQARFGERLQVKMQIEDGVKDIKIPAMIVQTLVENAIKHGIASVRGVGRVEVRAQKRGNSVQVDVLDNGPGLRRAEEADASPAEKSGGYGLKNVRDRLRGYFGDSAQLTLGRDASNLTVASVMMPAVTTAEPEAGA